PLTTSNLYDGKAPHWTPWSSEVDNFCLTTKSPVRRSPQSPKFPLLACVMASSTRLLHGSLESLVESIDRLNELTGGGSDALKKKVSTLLDASKSVQPVYWAELLNDIGNFCKRDL